MEPPVEASDSLPPLTSGVAGPMASHSNPEAGRRRSLRVFQAGYSAIICKGLVLGVNAISIAIAVRYLGPEQFGVFVTISTTLALLILLDLGIASTMTNLISEAYARDDKDLAGSYASTGFWIIVLIAICLGCIGAACWPFMHWAALFHLTGEANNRAISHAVAAAYIVFLVGLPAGLAAKFLAGYQEIKTANYFSAFGAVANLVAVVLITRLHGGMVWLVGGSSGALVGTNLACLAWLWFFHKPWLAPSFRRLHLGSVRPMMKSGSEFFILQLLGLVVFNSDNLVIAHYLGPAQVTPYSIAWKLVGYSAALQIILTPALWPAYAEAYIRRDLAWIRRTLRFVMLSTMGIASLSCFILILWGKPLIRIWAGAASVPDQSIIVLMCIWILICTYCSNISAVLMATSNTKMQAWLSVAATILNLAASIWLVQRIGPAGVILGTIGSYVLLQIGPQTWKVFQILRPSFPIALVPQEPAE
jgi:O-antigen/teichoic acid export membrane protein